MRSIFCVAVCLLTFCCCGGRCDGSEGHFLLLGAKDRLVVTDPAGKVRWQMPWGPIHDIHLTDDGKILTRRGHSEVVKIDPLTREVIWETNIASLYEESIEVHSFLPLPDHAVRVAVSGAGEIIDVDRQGRIVKKFAMQIDERSLHSDTRSIRSNDRGQTLVAHEHDGKVRIYSPAGLVVRSYDVPLFDRRRAGGHGPDSFGNAVFAAVELSNANLLVATGNGHSILEVDPRGSISRMISQNDLPGVRLSWVTTIVELPDGHWLIGNCHAGPGQPIVLEVDPLGPSVDWQLNGHDRFGNDVSNFAVIDPSQLGNFSIDSTDDVVDLAKDPSTPTK